MDKISNLTNLHSLNLIARNVQNINASDIIALKKLTTLAWQLPTKFFCSKMTQLRELHLNPQGTQILGFNLPLITSLAIRDSDANYFWWCVSTLTSLRVLTLYNVMDDTRVLHLTTLQRLTNLKCLNQRCKGYFMTALTRLQWFSFSRPVKWSQQFVKEIETKLPFLEGYEISKPSRTY